MPEMIPFAEFVQEHAGMTREEFLAHVEHPHLVFTDLDDAENSSRFQTIRLDPTDASQHGARSFTPTAVIPVRKEQRSNAFMLMITMGRAKNNDLVIADNRVSKFHAYFRDANGTWSITDANATNGTSVDGRRLEANQRVDIRSGSVIELSGSISVTFLTPEDLHRLIEEHGGL